ncbi:unnamed protein product [Parnassius mnemosyne]|uniref:Uncharacterized protein n=1 Tax=Parnassius mnemosyne TaxID=213953 RepID=A0AAV1LNH5_9NEOP
MDTICRLCCSTKFVNNHIFDEANALFLKMSLYLPIKVLKNDRLPQKICNKCSCKVNDLYQFCNEAIEAQARLRAILVASGVPLLESVNQTIKENSHALSSANFTVVHEQGTQTDAQTDCNEAVDNSQATVKIKEEKIDPKTSSPAVAVKTENDLSDNDDYEVTNGIYSDDSDDLSLLSLKEIKVKESDNDSTKNGEVQENKRGRKKKGKLKDLEMLINSLPGTVINVRNTRNGNKEVNKEKEIKLVINESNKTNVTSKSNRKIKKEEEPQDSYQCCICFEKFIKKSEILHHYKSHASAAAESGAPPPPPPLPAARPLRCPRCKKSFQESEWATHWWRHWARDTQPYRCGLCEKSFRDTYQLFKHGLAHETSAASEPEKRFICDLCPEGFVYMRCMLAHRARAHPGAGAVALRCRVCARAFAHTNSLRRHLRSHTGERNFLCSVCGKALSSAEHLKFHMRIHTGHKPNVCKTCGKGFVKKCNLTLHERVHSGEKPHVCSHCGKAFSQRSTLIIHERYHSGARPYACAACGRGFVARGLLTVHLRTRCTAPPPA